MILQYQVRYFFLLYSAFSHNIANYVAFMQKKRYKYNVCIIDSVSLRGTEE
ncbi:hypothetical protein HMPREF1548_00881 [Clostridium sp. KLE 1755]|nr:hypothetical protein HMPREF1548_00881 [Clostridium sp. KLE 1755]